jgi:hypothetical protein
MYRRELANKIVPDGGLSDVGWQKSHRSNSQGNCVQAAVTTEGQEAEYVVWREAQSVERFEAANVISLRGREMLLGSVLLAAA